MTDPVIPDAAQAAEDTGAKVRLIEAGVGEEGFGMSFDLSEFGDLSRDMTSALIDLLDATDAPNYLRLDAVDDEDRAIEFLICRPGVSFEDAVTAEQEVVEVDRIRAVAEERGEDLGSYLTSTLDAERATLIGSVLAFLASSVGESGVTKIEARLSPRGSGGENVGVSARICS